MFLYLIVLIVTLALFYVYYLLVKNHDYWKRKNVPYLEPNLLFGNYIDYIFLRKFAPKLARDICNKFPNEPYIGTFYGTDPALIVQDPEIIRLVLAKDFTYFSGREVTDYSHAEKLTDNVFFNGGDKWKVLRQNLTPLFTLSKIKNMFPLIKYCATDLDRYLEKKTKITQTLNSKSLLSRYTMDCVISATFGVNANTLNETDKINPFIVIGQKIFETSINRGLKIVCRAMWPSLFYGLGFSLFDEQIATFFRTMFLQGSDNQVKDSKRNNFIELLKEWKDKSYITGDSITNSRTSDKTTIKIKVTEELLVSQCIAFFGDGFETTSTSMSFILYELAKNKQAQNRVIEEVDAYLKSNNGVIEYECVQKLPFIEACIEETLRLYPVQGLMTREVMDEYTLPTGVSLRKGDRIHIPVYHIHRHPDHFPEPEVFLPERFMGEERKKIKPFTYLPFGEGPRICIGLRFSKMPMYAGLLTIFKKYTVELAENMTHNLDFEPSALATQSTTDINLKFIRRNVDN